MYFKDKTFTCILYTTAIIFTLQSIVWICLTISAILTFRCVLPTPQYENNSFIITTIVKLWFQGDGCMVKDDVPDYPDLHLLNLTEPGDVFSWMVGYLTVSIVNIITCILLLKYKAKEQLRFILGTWCFIALFTAIMDVILTIFFISDYCKIKEHVEKGEDKQNITTVPAAMFIISARGFGLWIINIALIVYFILWLYWKPLQEEERAKARKDREPHIHGYDNFTFQNASNSNFDWQTEPKGEKRGPAWRGEVSPRQLSFSSFEAVTPFNQEEYSPKLPRKAETPPANQRQLRTKGLCFCAEKQNNHSPGGNYHSHACPTLRSELEAKLQTMWEKADRPREKVKTLVDFSHDVRNFKQGSGRRGKQAPSAPKAPPAPPPAATTCANSNFY